MPEMFAGCLASNDVSISTPETDYSGTELREMAHDLLYDEAAGEDVALKNLEGDGARELAERWADGGRFRRKLEVMRRYLKGRERTIVEQIMGGGITDDARSSDAPASEGPPAVIPVVANASRSPKRTSTVQGRANAEQTARAMSRVRIKMPVYAEPGSGEETDDDDADARGWTAHMLFAPQAGIHEDPYGTSLMSSSPIASSLATTPRMQDIQRPKISRRGVLATPSSQGDSQEGRLKTPMQRMSTNSPLLGHSTPIIPESTPRTALRPTDSQGDAIGITAQIASNFNDSSISTSRIAPRTPSGSQNKAMGAMALATPTSRSRSAPQDSSPLGDRQNLSASPRPSSPSPAPKRRKLDNPGVLSRSSRASFGPKSIEESRIASELVQDTLLDVSSTSVQRKPASTPTNGHRQWQTLSAKSTLLLDRTEQTSACEDPDKARRRALKLEREITKEKLFRARPDLASEAYIAKRERRLTRTQREQERSQRRTPGLLQAELTVHSEQDLKDSRPASSLHVSSSRVLQRLPSRDQEDDSDVRINRERSRLLAEQFRQEIAQGKRPGLVIPRMKCLESQEEA